MGDDVGAPHVHELEYGVPPTAKIVLTDIAKENYLPSAGGETTWVVWVPDGPGVKSRRPLAVVTSAGNGIRYLMEPWAKVAAGALHVSYEGGRRPEDVAAELLDD